MKVDENIGKVIKCNNGAVIHLLGKGSKKGLYLSVCETCARKDPELHGFIVERSLTVIKNTNSTKCGCTSSVKYSELQNRVYLKRLNDDINNTFTVITKSIENRKSDILMYCSRHDFNFKTNITKIREGGYHCKLCKKDAMHRHVQNKKIHNLVAGVGINDSDYQVMVYEDNKVVWTCPFYLLWRGMITRCYTNNKTYDNVTVCEEWHIFSNFKEWMQSQDWEGKHLDKDIMSILNGSPKQYNPSNCLFVPAEVNSFFTKYKNKEFVTGANWCNHARKYRAKGYRKGRHYFLGLFNNPESAHKAWQEWKINILRDIRDGQECVKVKDALDRCVQKMQYEIDNNLITTWL